MHLHGRWQGPWIEKIIAVEKENVDYASLKDYISGEATGIRRNWNFDLSSFDKRFQPRQVAEERYKSIFL